MTASTLPTPTGGHDTATSPPGVPVPRAGAAPAVTTHRPPAPASTPARRARDDDRGQATAEYGLVILVAGLIALGVIAWVRDSSVFTDLFSGIIDTLTSSV